MAGVERILVEMRSNPKGVSFVELVKVCEQYFGPPRQRGSSHLVFRMPWAGDPRVNIQNSRGMAKPYQVRQVLAAIDRLKGDKR
ncbi:toxin HicA [Leifsonia sp. NPDC058194]|uniref:toxin HicA n=1 Tax=Leifsonia sp. NPDC058194 TaxID=3346374 RepID=UPI0036DD9653